MNHFYYLASSCTTMIKSSLDLIVVIFSSLCGRICSYFLNSRYCYCNLNYSSSASSNLHQQVIFLFTCQYLRDTVGLKDEMIICWESSGYRGSADVFIRIFVECLRDAILFVFEVIIKEILPNFDVPIKSCLHNVNLFCSLCR